MRKFTLLGGLLTFCGAAFSQYTTPDTGVTWGLQDLVTEAPATVTFENGEYMIANDLTVSLTDQLLIEEDAVVKIAADVEINVLGGFRVDAPDNILFTAVDNTQNFKGFRFEEGSVVYFKNATITYGGGLRVLTETFEMYDSEVSYQGSGSATSAITFSRGNPIVKDSRFIDNYQSAFGSGANQMVSATFIGNYLEGNGTDNPNRPQINMGPGGPDSTKIIGNTIIGNRNNTQVGGISVSSYSGLNSLFVIEGNTIQDNRYGISISRLYSNGRISGNIIENNDSQNSPMDGGSGITINATGDNTDHIQIYGNEIRNNLWGITVIGQARVNLGSTDENYPNPGGNIFSNNGNGGETYALYNNTAFPIEAMNNCWIEGAEELTEADVEGVITHETDNSSLGLVNYAEFGCGSSLSTDKGLTAFEFEMYPNPSTGTFTLQTEKEASFEIVNHLGQVVQKGNLSAGANKVSTTLQSGVYYVVVNSGKAVANQKIVIR